MRTKDNRWQIARTRARIVATYRLANLVEEDGDHFPGEREYFAHVTWRGPSHAYQVVYYYSGYRLDGHTLREKGSVRFRTKPSMKEVLWGFRRWIAGKKGA